MQLTLAQLQQIMPNGGKRVIEAFPFIQPAADKWGINTPQRMAAWLAQMAHECGEFRWMSEIWGPTPQQLKYEPPSALAAKLGNTQKGDGFAFRGASPVQLTGRLNFSKYGKMIGVDLVSHPELAREYPAGMQIAGAYWFDKGLNELADKGDFKEITRRINGGFNGLEARLRYWERAKKALGI